MNANAFMNGVYFSVFIVGARYVTVHSAYVSFGEVVEAIVEFVGEGAVLKPFVPLSMIFVEHQDGEIYNHELADIQLGV